MNKLKTWFFAYNKKERIKLCVLALLVLVCAAVVTTAVVIITSTQAEYAEAGREYDALLEDYKPQTAASASEKDSTAEYMPETAPKNPAEINKDYAGWIEIFGTKLDYPFVRAQNNEKYLNTTFTGVNNSSGAIFMDTECKQNFSSYHTVLYGHNIKNGSMFGTLAKYSDANYLAKNPLISITDVNGKERSYRIFAARVTDMYDAAYRLEFASKDEFAAFAAALGAPDGTAQLLTLSTCTNGAGEERLLIHAALVE